MSNLEKLEKKVEEKVNKVDLSEYTTSTVEKPIVDNVDYLKLNAQIDAVYRLVNNVTRRIERSLADVNSKQNLILKLLQEKGLDLDEIKKQEEIKRLEQKLKELKGV